MRQAYTCTCDCCKKDIADANNENDVTLNSGKYVYCDSCYTSLIAIWENWMYDTAYISEVS